MLLISAGAFWLVRGKRAWIKLPVLILSGATSTVSVLVALLALLSLVMGCNTHLDPVLSPSRKSAARVEIADEGATGGGTGVAVYTNHGFGYRQVFYGSWMGVQQDDVTWKNESNLQIRYEGRMDVCEGTSTIHVTCVRRPDRR